MRRFEAALQDLAAVYSLLGSSVVHIPTLRRAADKLIESVFCSLIDQQILYILDNVEARGEVWTPSANLASMI